MKNYFLRSRFAKAWQVADSLASRGLVGAKVSEEIRDMRDISCHGSETLGLASCESRLESKKHPNSFICEACNCGDFSHTQLTNLDENHYSKLDYPRVHCPKNMPGFSNYIPLTISENNMRKKLIEDTFGVDYLSQLLVEKKETEK
jgi:hypothetical protein